MSSDGFWNDQKNAQRIIQETNSLKNMIEEYQRIDKALVLLKENLDDLKDAYDEEMIELVEEDYQNVIDRFEKFEIMVLLSQPYDKSNAIIELHPGAGGTESQDWAMMLYRMYCRYAEKKGYKVTVLDYQDGEEAGIKSCSILIEGYMAYGYLKSEKGVHRLVRISPFDASGRRHTSFASVDVMPQFNNEI